MGKKGNKNKANKTATSNSSSRSPSVTVTSAAANSIASSGAAAAGPLSSVQQTVPAVTNSTVPISGAVAASIVISSNNSQTTSNSTAPAAEVTGLSKKNNRKNNKVSISQSANNSRSNSPGNKVQTNLDQFVVKTSVKISKNGRYPFIDTNTLRDLQLTASTSTVSIHFDMAQYPEDKLATTLQNLQQSIRQQKDASSVILDWFKTDLLSACFAISYITDSRPAEFLPDFTNSLLFTVSRLCDFDTPPRQELSTIRLDEEETATFFELAKKHPQDDVRDAVPIRSAALKLCLDLDLGLDRDIYIASPRGERSYVQITLNEPNLDIKRVRKFGSSKARILGNSDGVFFPASPPTTLDDIDVCLLDLSYKMVSALHKRQTYQQPYQLHNVATPDSLFTSVGYAISTTESVSSMKKRIAQTLTDLKLVNFNHDGFNITQIITRLQEEIPYQVNLSELALELLCHLFGLQIRLSSSMFDEQLFPIKLPAVPGTPPIIDLFFMMDGHQPKYLSKVKSTTPIEGVLRRIDVQSKPLTTPTSTSVVSTPKLPFFVTPQIDLSAPYFPDKEIARLQLEIQPSFTKSNTIIISNIPATIPNGGRVSLITSAVRSWGITEELLSSSSISALVLSDERLMSSSCSREYSLALPLASTVSVSLYSTPTSYSILNIYTGESRKHNSLDNRSNDPTSMITDRLWGQFVPHCSTAIGVAGIIRGVSTHPTVATYQLSKYQQKFQSEEFQVEALLLVHDIHVNLAAPNNTTPPNTEDTFISIILLQSAEPSGDSGWSILSQYKRTYQISGEDNSHIRMVMMLEDLPYEVYGDDRNLPRPAEKGAFLVNNPRRPFALIDNIKNNVTVSQALKVLSAASAIDLRNLSAVLVIPFPMGTFNNSSLMLIWRGNVFNDMFSSISSNALNQLHSLVGTLPDGQPLLQATAYGNTGYIPFGITDSLVKRVSSATPTRKMTPAFREQLDKQKQLTFQKYNLLRRTPSTRDRTSPPHDRNLPTDSSGRGDGRGSGRGTGRGSGRGNERTSGARGDGRETGRGLANFNRPTSISTHSIIPSSQTWASMISSNKMNTAANHDKAAAASSDSTNTSPSTTPGVSPAPVLKKTTTWTKNKVTTTTDDSMDIDEDVSTHQISDSVLQALTARILSAVDAKLEVQTTNIQEITNKFEQLENSTTQKHKKVIEVVNQHSTIITAQTKKIDAVAKQTGLFSEWMKESTIRRQDIEQRLAESEDRMHQLAQSIMDLHQMSSTVDMDTSLPSIEEDNQGLPQDNLPDAESQLSSVKYSSYSSAQETIIQFQSQSSSLPDIIAPSTADPNYSDFSASENIDSSENTTIQFFSTTSSLPSTLHPNRILSSTAAPLPDYIITRTPVSATVPLVPAPSVQFPTHEELMADLFPEIQRATDNRLLPASTGTVSVDYTAIEESLPTSVMLNDSHQQSISETPDTIHQTTTECNPHVNLIATKRRRPIVDPSAITPDIAMEDRALPKREAADGHEKPIGYTPRERRTKNPDKADDDAENSEFQTASPRMQPHYQIVTRSVNKASKVRDEIDAEADSPLSSMLSQLNSDVPDDWEEFDSDSSSDTISFSSCPEINDASAQRSESIYSNDAENAASSVAQGTSPSRRSPILVEDVEDADSQLLEEA